MFKYLAALALAAVVGGGVLAAEERTNWNTLPMDIDAILAGKQNPNNVVASTTDNDTLNAALAEIKDKIADKDTTATVKGLYAHAIAVMYVRTNPEATYDQMLAKLEEAFQSVNYPAKDIKGTYVYNCWKILMVNNCWYAGSPKKALQQACVEKFQNDNHPAVPEQLVRIMYQLEYPVEKWLPICLQTVTGKKWASSALLNYPEYKKQGAELFWELALNGQLNANQTTGQYQRVISYELTKDGYNAEELKSKLHRAITVHKIKARTWKPSKEGEENPWLAFVGAMQDTLKDL